MSWTDERIERLKKLWSEGLSASQIAAELGGVTRNAVIGKVHRLGLSNRIGGEGDAPDPQPARPETAAAKPAVAAAAAPARPAAQPAASAPARPEPRPAVPTAAAAARPEPVATPQSPIVERDRWGQLATDVRPTEQARLSDLLAAFKQMDVPVSEQINLLQMLHKTGKLHAELIID